MRVSAISAMCLLAFPAWAQNAGPPPAPVTGVIQSFDGKTLTLKAADGSMVAAALAPNVRIQMSVKKTLADIKPGDFIASGGTRGPDGKIHANEIRIFSAPGGEGQFPMTQPGQVMTNATVKEVMTDATVKQVGSAAGVPIIKLSFHGAGAPGARQLHRPCVGSARRRRQGMRWRDGIRCSRQCSGGGADARRCCGAETRRQGQHEPHQGSGRQQLRRAGDDIAVMCGKKWGRKNPGPHVDFGKCLKSFGAR